MMTTWRKSSHSALGNCIEAATWRKASRSVHNGACVAAGTGAGVVGVRDTQLGEGSPVLEFSPVTWRAFTGGLRG
jgi:Domain of unknown function (DUF397)